MVTALVEILTTRPKPWATMTGTQARAIMKGPTTLASTMFRKPCGSACQNRAGSMLKVSLISRMPRPALLTKPSMRPQRCRQACATRWQSSQRATSACKATACSPVTRQRRVWIKQGRKTEIAGLAKNAIPGLENEIKDLVRELSNER